MAKFIIVCFLLASLCILQAMADKSEMETLSKNASRIKVGNENEPHGLVDDAPSSSPGVSFDGKEEPNEAEAPGGMRKMGKHRSDDSVAGGGVIIGGLVTAIFASIYCYIRVTRKRNDDVKH